MKRKSRNIKQNKPTKQRRLVAGKRFSAKDFVPAKTHIEVSVGESVRIIRELQGLSQNDLAQETNIPQSTISSIEHDRIKLGVERAKILANALRCHPAVLVFPGWQLSAA